MTLPVGHQEEGDGDTSLRGLGDSALQSETLESLATAKNYHAWLTQLAVPYLGVHALELGSGLGDYAQAWLDAGVLKLSLTELDPTRLEGLQQRFEHQTRIQVGQLDSFKTQNERFSSLVAFNVLEHISDDVGMLRASHQLLVPGGAVIMFVPAFMFAMGRFDRTVGHFRRYTKGTLRSAYHAAGLEMEKIHYVNAPGLAAWFVAVRLLRMTPGDSLALRLWDRSITRVTRVLESKIDPPFGQSVFAVGRVPVLKEL